MSPAAGPGGHDHGSRGAGFTGTRNRTPKPTPVTNILLLNNSVKTVRPEFLIRTSTRDREIPPVNLDNSLNPSPVQPTVVTAPSISIFRFLSRPTNLNPNVTAWPQTTAADSESPCYPSREAWLVNLREETEAAELRAKLALADEATALARRNTKLLDQWTLKPWNWTVSATYYESRALPHLNSRVRKYAHSLG